jgi:hypothetical protein
MSRCHLRRGINPRQFSEHIQTAKDPKTLTQQDTEGLNVNISISGIYSTPSQNNHYKQKNRHSHEITCINF